MALNRPLSSQRFPPFDHKNEQLSCFTQTLRPNQSSGLAFTLKYDVRYVRSWSSFGFGYLLRYWLKLALKFSSAYQFDLITVKYECLHVVRIEPKNNEPIVTYHGRAIIL